MNSVKLGPVPKIHQPNTFTFSEWYDAYYEQVKDLYYIIKKECRLNNLYIFDKMDVQMFVEYVYSKSSKRIPRWYKNAQRHTTEHDEHSSFSS